MKQWLSDGHDSQEIPEENWNLWVRYRSYGIIGMEQSISDFDVGRFDFGRKDTLLLNNRCHTDTQKSRLCLTTVAALLMRFYDETGRRYDRPLSFRYYGVAG